MELKTIKERLAPILKYEAPRVGELILIWIAGVVAYAIVTRIEPFYMEGWFEFRFIILRKIPPQEHEWRVRMDHLQGQEFQIDNHPACILALKLETILTPSDDSDTIRTRSWKEMIDGKKKGDCPPGGCSGCSGPDAG